MPYKDPARKAAWEKTHRASRSEAFLSQANYERECLSDSRRLEIAEKMAGENRDTAVLEYEASLGLGNPAQDSEIQIALKRK